MKNIQIIDAAVNCVYDIFAATEKEFSIIFPRGQDIAFIDELRSRVPARKLRPILANLWTRRLAKTDANGIHGILFYELESKKAFYPTRRDEEAVNPDGSRLRRALRPSKFGNLEIQSTTKAKRPPKAAVPMSEFSAEVGRALRLAGKDARKTARMYGTPIYIVKDGKIVAEKP